VPVGGGPVAPLAARDAAGIWRHAHRYSVLVPPRLRLSHGEGNTPLVSYPGLAAACGLDSLWLKREDLNPTGSHKARGLAFQVAALRLAAPEPRAAVISSSGNGAIAAAGYARLAGLRLAACVSPATAPDKLARLADLGACVLASEQAIALAESLAQARGWPNLRPSTDPLAPEGFMSLGWELAEAAVDAQGIFLFASSGTGLVGMARGLAQQSHEAFGAAWRAPLHVVQGAGGDPIAAVFDRRPAPQSERSIIGRLGSRKTRRLGEATRAVRDSGGWGWIIGDEEALAAESLLLAAGIEAALEGAAALAAARRAAMETGLRRAVVIISGRASAPDAFTPVRPVRDLADALNRVADWP